MKTILDLPGGPAFPINIPGYGDNGCPGMSLRDWFASQVIATMISKCEARDGSWDAAAAALGAYEIADVMMEARELEMQTVKDGRRGVQVRHPTGSEEFASKLRALGMPAPCTPMRSTCAAFSSRDMEARRSAGLGAEAATDRMAAASAAEKATEIAMAGRLDCMHGRVP